MAVLGPHLCARALPSCGKRGPLLIAVRGPLTIAASPAAEHRLQTRRLSNCGSRAQLLRGMWDLPRPGLEPTSPALAGRLSTTAPPGKPPKPFYMRLVYVWIFGIHVGPVTNTLWISRDDCIYCLTIKKCHKEACYYHFYSNFIGSSMQCNEVKKILTGIKD